MAFEVILSDEQQAEYGALAAGIIAASDQPMAHPYDRSRKQMFLPEGSIEPIIADLRTIELAAYILTLPGGKLIDPFPEVARLNSHMNRLRQAGWERMIAGLPDQVGVYAHQEDAEYFDDHKKEDVKDRITAIGLTFSYGLPTPASEGWAVRDMQFTQSLNFWKANSSSYGVIDRTETLHSGNTWGRDRWFDQSLESFYLDTRTFLGLTELIARNVEQVEVTSPATL